MCARMRWCARMWLRILRHEMGKRKLFRGNILQEIETKVEHIFSFGQTIAEIVTTPQIQYM